VPGDKQTNQLCRAEHGNQLAYKNEPIRRKRFFEFFINAYTMTALQPDVLS